MCHAIPAQIIEIYDDSTGLVESEGVRKKICMDFVPQAEVGEYVIVHVGCALSVISAEEAAETLALFGEVASFDEEE